MKKTRATTKAKTSRATRSTVKTTGTRQLINPLLLLALVLTAVVAMAFCKLTNRAWKLKRMHHDAMVQQMLNQPSDVPATNSATY